METDSKNLKVLMISNQGGYSHIQTHIFYIVRILRNQEVDISILSPSKGSWTSKMEHFDYKVFHHDFTKKSLKNFLYLYKFFKEQQFDVIHSHANSYFWVYAARLAKKDTLIYHTFHTGEEILINNLIDRYGINKFDHMITVTLKQQKYLPELKKNDQKISHIPYGISERFFVDSMPYQKRKYRKNFRLPEKTFLVGTVGRFEEKNGFNHLIEMLELIKDHTDMKIVIVGDGVNKNQFENEIEALGLKERFIFTGYCDRIYDIIPAFDVLVLPYVTDEYSIIPVEAMAAGIPVVAFKQPYLDDLTEEFESIFLVHNQDSKALAHQIKEFYQNVKLLENSALRAYTASQKYHQELMIKNLFSLYGIEYQPKQYNRNSRNHSNYKSHYHQKNKIKKKKVYKSKV